MNKNRIEGFLVSLEADGILKADQQSMVMQSELESVGCGENVNCTNAVAVCGGSSVFNKGCKNFDLACSGSSNSGCDNLEKPSDPSSNSKC